MTRTILPPLIGCAVLPERKQSVPPPCPYCSNLGADVPALNIKELNEPALERLFCRLIEFVGDAPAQFLQCFKDVQLIFAAPVVPVVLVVIGFAAGVVPVGRISGIEGDLAFSRLVDFIDVAPPAALPEFRG